jgi:hypothetical protein
MAASQQFRMSGNTTMFLNLYGQGCNLRLVLFSVKSLILDLFVWYSSLDATAFLVHGHRPFEFKTLAG